MTTFKLGGEPKENQGTAIDHKSWPADGHSTTCCWTRGQQEMAILWLWGNHFAITRADSQCDNQLRTVFLWEHGQGFRFPSATGAIVVRNDRYRAQQSSVEYRRFIRQIEDSQIRQFFLFHLSKVIFTHSYSILNAYIFIYIYIFGMNFRLRNILKNHFSSFQFIKNRRGVALGLRST